MNDYQTLLKEYYEFACSVHWLLKAQEEVKRASFTPNGAEKRAKAQSEVYELKKHIRADIEDVVTQYEEECL